MSAQVRLEALKLAVGSKSVDALRDAMKFAEFIQGDYTPPAEEVIETPAGNRQQRRAGKARR